MTFRQQPVSYKPTAHNEGDHNAMDRTTRNLKNRDNDRQLCTQHRTGEQMLQARMFVMCGRKECHFFAPCFIRCHSAEKRALVQPSSVYGHGLYCCYTVAMQYSTFTDPPFEKCRYPCTPVEVGKCTGRSNVGSIRQFIFLDVSSCFPWGRVALHSTAVLALQYQRIPRRLSIRIFT